MEKINIGISKCLLGEKVRYDGGHKLDLYIKNILGKYFNFISICPEVECGLPVPREAMHLVGDPENPRLETVRTKINHTQRMLLWAEKKLEEIKDYDLCGFIFKSKSPSCGIKSIKVYLGDDKYSQRGIGIFAREFMRKFPLVPIEDEGRLHNLELRDNFLERVFVFKKWRDFEKKGKIKDFIDFHTDHKLIIMSHSPKNLRILGKIVSETTKENFEHKKKEYITLFMETLRLIATVKKNVNVLYHIMGYFKKELSKEDKEEFLELIENYRRGHIPLIVPITLVNHYVRKLDIPYLKRQYYLKRYPLDMIN